MSEDNDIGKDSINDNISEIVPVSKNALCILVTDADKHGTDIAAMSDFFDLCVQQMSYELKEYSTSDVLREIPVADFGIINDVVHQAEVLMKGTYGYIPDFDSLPHDIKVKFDKGIYKIGESRQVDGNMRAVILDENDVRVKDITLKRVRNDTGAMETSRSIGNQLQMKQIYAKLNEIQELQIYQIKRDRDRDIIIPFLNARDYILRAQTTSSLEDRREYLKKSSDELTRAINGVYTDLSTSAEHLAKLTRWPIFQRSDQIRDTIKFLTSDLQLATKYVGVQVQVLDYLGDKDSSKMALRGYQHVMQDFLIKEINNKGQSAARLIHLNYPYDDSNRDCWQTFSKELRTVLDAGFDAIDGHKDIYLVSLEDVKDGQENE
ncbi:hypothetical protein HNQ56_000782 [Anaerotaenia torta]|uniref:hypothetical protein n=1 Tax=Anaerotaenia torta TaxID=433293 RepID=UPI003D23B37F